jgi:hypothetical protein
MGDFLKLKLKQKISLPIGYYGCKAMNLDGFILVIF